MEIVQNEWKIKLAQKWMKLEGNVLLFSLDISKVSFKKSITTRVFSV